MKLTVFFLAVVFGTAFHITAGAQKIVFTVETAQVLREDADKFIGVNLNYIRDEDRNRPLARPLDAALKGMGVKWLRYPGGEKSDFYLWSQPPYTRPHPVSLGYYGTVKSERMDVDAFVAHARAIGAEPYCVVGYDNMTRTQRTRKQWIESAVAWVRYANITKKYRIKYWEIGNENWHNQTSTPQEMAEIVAEFSTAMRTVDLSIKIGASGSAGGNWWANFLPKAAPHLDFITLSLYNTWEWKGYDYLLAHPDTNLIRDAETALTAIDQFAPPEDRARLRVIVAETNSMDYSPNGWKADNTLGHCLVTFDTLGKLMLQPRILSSMVWTTRWMDDKEAAQTIWYSLDANNQILPTGRAIGLWGQFMQRRRIAVSGGTPLVSAYAARSSDGKKMTVWVLNRGKEKAEDLEIKINSGVRYQKTAVSVFTGNDANDPNPMLKQAGTLPLDGDQLKGLTCPGLSVTVLTFEK